MSTAGTLNEKMIATNTFIMELIPNGVAHVPFWFWCSCRIVRCKFWCHRGIQEDGFKYEPKGGLHQQTSPTQQSVCRCFKRIYEYPVEGVDGAFLSVFEMHKLWRHRVCQTSSFQDGGN